MGEDHAKGFVAEMIALCSAALGICLILLAPPSSTVDRAALTDTDIGRHLAPLQN